MEMSGQPARWVFVAGGGGPLLSGGALGAGSCRVRGWSFCRGRLRSSVGVVGVVEAARDFAIAVAR